MEILSIKRQAGVAGQVSYLATVQYPDEPAETVTLVGSVYGQPGPVVMISPSGNQAFVTNPGRCGPKFDEQWVRAFFV